MKRLPLIAFSVVLIPFNIASAQQPDEESVNDLYRSFIERYGPDQDLANGVRYYNLHSRYGGHKYFLDEGFVRGALTLDCGEYRDVALKYDLYAQQVILQVKSLNDTYSEIIVTDSRLRGFELEGKKFSKLLFPETDTLIFQVIGEEKPFCLIHWTREIIPNSTGPQSIYEFSSMKRASYILSDSGLHSFRGARSFARSFPGHRSEVLHFIREKGIRFRKAGDAELEELMKYCRTLTIEE